MSLFKSVFRPLSRYQLPVGLTNLRHFSPSAIQKCSLLQNKPKESPPATTPSQTPANFEEFGKLRNKLKWTKRCMGVPGAFFGVFGLVAASESNPDVLPQLALSMSIEPELGFMISALVSALGGFMMTGGLVNVGFRIFQRKTALRMDMINEDFMKRIYKYRVEGLGKLNDDFHGEKIVTLRDYRKWLRKQYQRKRLQSSPSKDPAM